jgi:hypothetical protein
MSYEIPIETYITVLKRAAKKQQRLSPDDTQSECLKRIAQYAGFQSWSSLLDIFHHPYPGQKVMEDDREKIVKGLKKAIPQALDFYVQIEAMAILHQQFVQKRSLSELEAEGLEPIDIYDEVLIDFESLLSSSVLKNMVSDFERDGVWGRSPEDIMIDEFSMSEW